MAHLIQPILIDEERHCCDLTLKRTAAILTDDAAETLVPNKWRVYHAVVDGSSPNPFAQSARIFSGSVKFGICCASRIKISLSGWVEAYDSPSFPRDWIELLQNGFRVEDGFYSPPFRGDDNDDYYSRQYVEVGPFLIDLEDRPCGHIFEIRGSTQNTFRNNNIYWDALIEIRSSDDPADTRVYNFSNPFSAQFNTII